MATKKDAAYCADMHAEYLRERLQKIADLNPTSDELRIVRAGAASIGRHVERYRDKLLESITSGSKRKSTAAMS